MPSAWMIKKRGTKGLTVALCKGPASEDFDSLFSVSSDGVADSSVVVSLVSALFTVIPPFAMTVKWVPLVSVISQQRWLVVRMTYTPTSASCSSIAGSDLACVLH